MNEPDVVLGFDSESEVPFGGTCTLTRRPDRAFQAVELAIPAELGRRFEVIDLRIGLFSQLSQLDSRGIGAPVPAWIFGGSTFQAALRFDACAPDEDFVIIVRNVDAARRSHRFQAIVRGHGANG